MTAASEDDLVELKVCIETVFDDNELMQTCRCLAKSRFSSSKFMLARGKSRSSDRRALSTRVVVIGLGTCKMLPIGDEFRLAQTLPNMVGISIVATCSPRSLDFTNMPDVIFMGHIFTMHAADILQYWLHLRIRRFHAAHSDQFLADFPLS